MTTSCVESAGTKPALVSITAAPTADRLPFSLRATRASTTCSLPAGRWSVIADGAARRMRSCSAVEKKTGVR